VSARGISFEGSFLHDAVFRNCDLYGSIFARAAGNITIPTKEVLYSPGFDGVDFRGATLNHADFTDANFAGADFRDAVFEETIFEGTILDGAIFSKERIDNLNLSEKQRASIIAI
jgi:uncharacterized protein YjbI with pentapeptide repeats